MNRSDASATRSTDEHGVLPGTDDEQQIEAWLSAGGDKTPLVVENCGIALEELHFHGAG
jgi:hypothetical protein